MDTTALQSIVFASSLKIFRQPSIRFEALHRLVEAYLSLGLTDDAQTAAAILVTTTKQRMVCEQLRFADNSRIITRRKEQDGWPCPPASHGPVVLRAEVKTAHAEASDNPRYADHRPTELEFSSGLNVLTGETGAGKSILLDSLGFVLGWRGRAELVRRGAEQGEVSASFELGAYHHALQPLQEAGLADGQDVILRRVNSKDGRKTAWINDRRVSGDLCGLFQRICWNFTGNMMIGVCWTPKVIADYWINSRGM